MLKELQGPFTLDELIAVLVLRRHKLGWGQRQLAEKMKVSQPALCALETKRTMEPKVRTLARWMDALGITGSAIVSDGVISFWITPPEA